MLTHLLLSLLASIHTPVCVVIVPCERGKSTARSQAQFNGPGLHGHVQPKPATRGVSALQIALAASPGTSREKAMARMFVATHFQHGAMLAPTARSHMREIDLGADPELCITLPHATRVMAEV